ncbi:Hypothetical protein Minf_0012 [Methylacidiphilum infernorum V4]|uniref:Uncharacterized protein n=1 Tax=Methylacidiphilum infernorum (isolate V4) TaxID=481448 RepID=B3DWH7_METI4|nr:Hypothetical protein Minf_0012 [Methylacidiphilum infernorum V4]
MLCFFLMNQEAFLPYSPAFLFFIFKNFQYKQKRGIVNRKEIVKGKIKIFLDE